MKKGSIGFNNHRIRCVIGVHDLERTREQELFVDLRVTTDFSACIQSDDLNDTIDYQSLADVCTELAKKNGYYLVEKFASDAIEHIRKKFSVEEVWIRVKKTEAIETADCSVVEMRG